MRTLALLVSLPLAVACGDKNDVVADADSGTSEDGGEAGTEDTGPVENAVATGISITKVTTNQGTTVDISTDGVWVDATSRRTFIVGNRDTLVQVHFTVAPDWVPREIEARLTLGMPDGTDRVLSQVLMVEGDSYALDFSRIFFFGLVSEEGQTDPGVTFSVELFEVTPEAPDLPAGRTTSPEAGPGLVGFQSEPMEMNVMFVPVTYNGVTPTLDESERQFLIDHVLEHNPLQKVTAVFHDPVEYTQTITDLGQILPVMSNLRNAEGNAYTNIYYTALVPVQYPGGVAGIARLASASPSAERINANVWFSTNNSDTVVHEIGHNQGLSHVFCPGGNSAGDDPSYPEANGLIREMGFGIRKFDLYSPDSTFDYMSYCGPSWVSDWTWDKTFWRIFELTSWDYDGDVPPGNPEPVLKGIVYEDGRTEWWTGTGEIDPEALSGNHTIAFDGPSGRVETLATVEPLTDGRTLWLEAPLPAEWGSVRGIEYRGDRASAVVDRAAIVAGY